MSRAGSSTVVPEQGNGGSNAPHVSELVRRVQRIEDRMDARVVTSDVFQATQAAHAIEVAGLQHRITALEESISSATRLLIGAFLAIIIQFVVLAVSVFGRGAS